MNHEHNVQYDETSPAVNTMKTPTTSSSSENIRERLNLHVKRRIQVHEKTSPSQHIRIHSSPSSSSSLSPTDSNSSIKQEQIACQNFTIAQNQIIKATTNSRPLLLTRSIIDDNLKKPIKTAKKNCVKVLATDNRVKYVPQLFYQQNEHKINAVQQLITKRIPPMLIGINTAIKMTGSMPLGPSTPMTIRPQSSPETKSVSEKNSTNSYDILHMVLNEKKNSLLHDPEVQQFLSTIYKIGYRNRNKR